MAETLLLLVWLTVVLGIYFLPSIIAVFRRPTGWPYLFLLNLLIGWTVIGWGVAMSWSLEESKPRVCRPASEPQEQQIRKRAA